MPAKKTRIIEGPELRIVGKLNRFDIVKKVVEHFIDFERYYKGGVQFRYPVEKLSSSDRLYIHRPGIKWNFDFKVIIPENSGLKEGRHDQIAKLLLKIQRNKQKEFKKIWSALSSLYHCENNDVDELINKLKIANRLSIAGETLFIDVILKVIKWLFVMEDIIYWHHEGRAFLFNFVKYVVNENDESRLEKTFNKIKSRKIKPDGVRKLLNELGLEWDKPE